VACYTRRAQAYSLLLIGTHMNDGFELNVALLCGAGFLRAVSSSLVWVYSTLVIQSMVLGPKVRSLNFLPVRWIRPAKCPGWFGALQGGNPWENPVFGRVFALEMSVFTTGKLGSFVLGGAGLGLFTCNAQCAAEMLLSISVAATVIWTILLLGSSCHAPDRTILAPGAGSRQSLL
jgi:hypothetical protein